ncbi:hypothetical protein [Gallaecimonas pentaromativorans]|uniref:hypothetical protein n=1 Tax=Gallaecimonas pentaromativorans TaxID=584787 RepID=UPI003A8CB1C9
MGKLVFYASVLLLTGCLYQGEGIAVFGIENNTPYPAHYTVTWDNTSTLSQGKLGQGEHIEWTSGMRSHSQSDSMVKSVSSVQIDFPNSCTVTLGQGEIYQSTIQSQYTLLFSEALKKCQ